MKVLNVFIEKKRLTQFHGIHQIIVGEWMLNIMDSYNIAIRNGQLECNVDILYVGHHDTYNALSEYRHLLGKRLVYVKQQKKSSNLATYNALINCDSYIKSEIHGCFNAGDDLSEYIFEPALYYVKPEYGARSLNQFIVDSSKVSLGHFLQTLKRFNPDKELQAKHIADLVAKANGYIRHTKGHERFENEHASTDFSYCVHKQVAHIAKEYRVINNGFGNQLVFFERIRNDANDGVISNEIEYVKRQDAPSEEILTQLKQAFRKNSFFHGSVDLVVTENGRWSIIETSNQFGGADIHPIAKEDIIQGVLSELMDYSLCDVT